MRNQRIWMVLSGPRIKVVGHEVVGQVEPREVVGGQGRQGAAEVAQHPGVVELVSTKGAGLEAVELEKAQQRWLVV